MTTTGLHNRERGTLTVEIAGQSYHLVLDLNAMIGLEGHFSQQGHFLTILEIAALMRRGSLTHSTGLLWAALQRNHPSITFDDTAALIWKAGGLEVFNDKLEALMASMNADPKDLAALEVDPAEAARPPLRPLDGSVRASMPTTGAASMSAHGVVG